MRASMAQATVANGTLSVTDADAGQAGFQAGTTHGAYGDLTLNADGTWNYTAANGNLRSSAGQWRYADRDLHRQIY